MAEYTLKDMELVRDIPGNPPEKGGPAKIYRLHFEEKVGEAEMFVTARTQLPAKGERMRGEIVQPDNPAWGPKWQPEGSKPRSAAPPRNAGIPPEERKKIQRQHSQQMALMREENLGAKWTGEQLRSVINWFEDDITTKDRAIKWDGLTSDVPVDTSDFDPKVD